MNSNTSVITGGSSPIRAIDGAVAGGYRTRLRGVYAAGRVDRWLVPKAYQFTAEGVLFNALATGDSERGVVLRLAARRMGASNESDIGEFSFDGGQWHFQSQSLSLARGDVLSLYMDGLVPRSLAVELLV